MHDEPFLDVAGRIADGQAVDWPLVTATTSSNHEHELADELALVARIADGHRRLHQVLPPADRGRDVDRTRWAHLDLLNIVGRGSYGTVYRAWDTRLERLVALKLFHRAPHPEVVMREGRMLARVRHENVVTVYGADVVGGVAGLWMEFVHGQTLDQIVKEHGPMGPREAATVGLHVARALGAIHGAQLLHCDVKAQNVVREATGRVVLMDLGAGRPLPEHDDDREVTGTPRYMAPELFRLGTAATRATDVYSLGVLLYYLVSGRFPVDGQSYQELKRAHLEGQIVPLVGAPPAYTALIGRTLDRDPDRRIDSTEAVAHALAPIAAPPRRRTRMWMAVTAALVIAMGTIGTWYFTHTATANTNPTASRRTIAVLPIKNLTGDPSKAYLADGLTEVLIANLARVRAFRVPLLAAVAELGQTKETAAQTATKLDVDYLLTGSITQADTQFRMAVHLIDPQTGVAIWGEEIERAAPGMMSAQADVARLVAERLAMTLTGEEQRALQTRAVDARAQDAYLRGLAVRSIPTSRREAARWFRQATEFDPLFAPGWAELAKVEVVLNSDQNLAGRMAHSAVVREMAERAIGLDPTLASGYAALGTVLFYDDWNFNGAENAFKRALVVDPSHAFARQRFSMLLAAVGRLDEAIATAREAVLIEPLVPAQAITLGGIYYYARDFDRAEAEASRALQLSPNFPTALFLLGQIAAARGQYDDASGFVRRALVGSDHVGWLAELARISALAGHTDEARRLTVQLDARQKSGDAASPDNRAYFAIAEGRVDDAFRILGEAIDQRSANMLWLAVDPRVDFLRNDPRFALVLKRIGVRP